MRSYRTAKRHCASDSFPCYKPRKQHKFLIRNEKEIEKDETKGPRQARKVNEDPNKGALRGKSEGREKRVAKGKEPTAERSDKETCAVGKKKAKANDCQDQMKVQCGCGKIGSRPTKDP